MLPLSEVLGLLDGQPADRPGPLGDADADGRRLRRDRQRRDPAHAAHRPLGRRRARRRRRRATASSRARPPRRCARCSRACSRRAAPRARSRSPATSSPARPAPRTRSTRRPASTPRRATSRRSSASRPAARPEAARRGHGRRAAGRDLRRHGRGAGVRQDHGVRAAVPADPAVVSGPGSTPRWPWTLRELFGAGRADRRGHRARLRQPRGRARARCSSACRASRATGTTSPPTRWRAAPSALVVERPLGLGVPEVVVADVRAAMAPAAARFYGDPTARADGRRHHRHERQDDDGVPRARAARGRRAAGRAARHGHVGRRRRRGADGQRTTPEAIDLQRDVRARCSTAATRAARWRSPRTRSSCTAPTRSTGRPRSSRT